MSTRLPALLSRNNPKAYKNQFGHVLILAGSKRMLGAAALTSLAAMRAGAGLVTLGIPDSLNGVVQKKIANVIMTLPLEETREQTLNVSAFKQIQKSYINFSVVAVGPGLSTHSSTQKLILKIIAGCPLPMVIDADAITALSSSKNLNLLKKTSTTKILTPHPGEMARLIHVKKETIKSNRNKFASDFAKKYRCILLLKGHRTIVADSKGKVYINKTGNAGMATAGSGDVLTGMIAALLGQGLSGFDAAKWGAYLHGKAGDLAAENKTRAAMIASDIIDDIPKAIRNLTKSFI